MEAPSGDVLIFDGDCGFCTSAARWVSRGWGPGPRAVAWQHLGDDGLAAYGLGTSEAQEAVWWVDGSGRLHRGGRAIARSLVAGSGWRRRAGALLGRPPLSWVAAAAYPLIVRYRHRLPGGTPACRIAPPEPDPARPRPPT